MLGQNPGKSFTHKIKKKDCHTNISQQTPLEVQLPRPTDCNLLDSYLWELLKSLVYSVQLKIKRHFGSEFLVHVKPFVTIPGPFILATVHDYTCPMRAMIQREQILSIDCKLWTEKQ